MDRYPIPSPSVLREVIRKDKPPAPLTAMFHITEHCNVRCEFCWHHSFLRKDRLVPHKMDTTSVVELIEDLAAMGTTDITLSANGEPTLHPGFPAMVETAKKNNMRIKTVTNLTIVTPAIISALSRTDLLVINLAAVNQESYQAIYAPLGKVSFDQLLENIKALSALGKRGPELKLGYVITKNNYRNVRDALKIAEDCGIPSIRFKIMDPSPFTEPLILNDEEKLWLSKEILTLNKIPTVISSNLSDILTMISPTRGGQKNGAQEVEHGRCFVGWFVMDINENGQITLCCQNDKLVIGNWKEQKLKDIWEGEKAQEFRNTTKTRIDFDHPLYHACRGCFYSNPKHYTRQINQPVN